MPVARALRLPITAVVAALALSGCMSTSGPVAVGPQGVDAVTYGPAYAPAPVADAGGGGAISALRSAFASTSPGYGYAAPAAAPVVYAAASPGGPPAGYDNGYHLGPGDKLRVVVYGQEGLTNSYAIDAAGAITMPLIGSVPARGRTPAGLAGEISARLRNGYIREPSVAVEIESYRPFFILGEVQAPGQYPYVPNMTVESAVAIAGGFSPRARRDSVTLTHTDASGSGRFVVPLGTPMSPGDTVFVGERWF
ncbi:MULTISPECIES: polysaccharide biosynthesis/export family protein [Bradyrhizobium]|uniref:polysaccharide biosynthesis/export family protein n=1 Tax=Bradyrhizobium TaxID=374 RepID=UPI0014578555|nr:MULTISPECIES: polysaccharide biosynthesis/export family protein [Bradyrhizobium]MCA1399319.1 polysaccharide export protein [Bradyrhizobium sp. BRP56]MCP1911216.1 polysaccharide export outer membrane protein [Bradyrhizobium elkanii]MCC8946521.1 polysaccharide export protein [Bradyrhizobium brasilense]MCP1828791.1 polysaccharide export outer membrane protein [Bradyrhizobium sp. USDA 4545]MCP1847313.1 polysaccharide export outer membrane protein [Bradyrhizobium sp. USDA 4541]